MIRLTTLSFLLAATAAAQPLAGEAPAETRFHDGARLFADGDVDAAVATVDAGLAEAPADARLRALRELLRQQKESSGGGGQQPEDPQQGDDPPDEPPDDGQGDGETPPEPGPTQTPPQNDGTGDRGGDAPPQDGQGTPGEARAPMSRAEAEALLDAVGGDERLLLRRQRQRGGGGAIRPERDW